MKLKTVERMTQKELDFRLKWWRRGRLAKLEGKKYNVPSFEQMKGDHVIALLSWTKGYGSVK